MTEHLQKALEDCPYCKLRNRPIPKEERKIIKEHNEMEWPLDYSWEKSLENLRKVVEEGSFKSFVLIYDHEMKADGKVTGHTYRSIFGHREDDNCEAALAILISQLETLLSRLANSILP